MNHKIKRRLTFSFLSLLMILGTPLSSYAADAPLTKELQISGSSESDYKDQAQQAFDDELTTDGKDYKLDDISYEVISTKYLDTKVLTVNLDGLEDGSEPQPDETIVQDGITYMLDPSSTVKEENVIREAGTQQVNAYDDYDYSVSADSVPATKSVPVQNQLTGEMQDVVCQLSGVSVHGTKTIDNTMSLTFSNYDAAYYSFGDAYIPRNDDQPAIAGYEDQLLASVGAADGSKITSISWDGDPYTGEDGILYRNATANVQQQVQVYRANYSGVINTPEEKSTTYTVTYTAPDPDGAVEYTVQATASYTEVKQKQSIVPYIIAAGVGILILAIFIVLILYLLRKKRKTAKDNENN